MRESRNLILPHGNTQRTCSHYLQINTNRKEYCFWRHSYTSHLLLAILVLIASFSLPHCSAAQNNTIVTSSLENKTSDLIPSPITNKTFDGGGSSGLKNRTISSSEEDYDDEDDEGARMSPQHSKIAAVIVYISVILIALFGILVKYFVTQYEKLQAKAEFEYQQLRSAPC